MTYTQISAGGVVYRHHEGALQIQLILDRYGKTSLPKGKMEAGETVEQTALREICEETGIVGSITSPVDIIAYKYHHPEFGQVDKEVHYYLVKAEKGSLKPQIEEINGWTGSSLWPHGGSSAATDIIIMISSCVKR